MFKERHISHPDSIDMEDGLRDALIDLAEEIYYDEQNDTTSGGRYEKPQITQMDTINDRVIFDISSYTDPDAIAKIATTPMSEARNKVEYQDRELLPAELRPYVLPGYDIGFSGRLFVQRKPTHIVGDEATSIAADLLNILIEEINETASWSVEMDITTEDVAWCESHPVIQHWGHHRR